MLDDAFQTDGYNTGEGAASEDATERAIDFHLFGQVAFDDMLKLQRRLAYEISGNSDGRGTVLFAEHEPVITIGRAGSRDDVKMSSDFSRVRRIETHWVARGGGAVLHGPGQLAVYVLFPLERWGVSAGDHVRRLQQGFVSAMRDVRTLCHEQTSPRGLWGRSGQLASFGVLVRQGVSMHGAWLNVHPNLSMQRLIRPQGTENSVPGGRHGMGSLLSESAASGKMPLIRSALIRRLAEAFSAQRFFTHSGHPLLSRVQEAPAKRVV